jgi:hypothetical protein
MNKKLKILILWLVGVLLFFPVIIVSYKLIESRRIKSAEYQEYFNEAKNTQIALSQDVRTTIVTAGQSNNDYVGIGIIFRIVDEVVIVTEVIDNSPGSKADIEVGDRIIMINGKYTHGLSANDVSSALQGKRGTSVALNIYRDSFGDKSKNVTIIRDLIDNSERREYFLFMDAGEGGEDLGNNYRKFRGKLYYWDDGGGQAVPSMVPIDADPASFESFVSKYCPWPDEEKFNRCERYGKDRKHVFSSWLLIKEADPETFVLLGSGYKLGGGYGKDKNYAFYGTDKILNSDAKSFEIIGNKYAKDKNGVYYWESAIKGADPSTFKLVDTKRDLAKDKNSYYWRDEKITPEKFKDFWIKK